MRRPPSRWRSTCTMRSTAPTICCLIALLGRPMLPICTMFSIRVSASRVLLAWMVDIDPSWPVFIACNMSNASDDRTSPMITRSGRIRRAFRTRSRWVISPRPSRLAGARLHAYDMRLLQLQFGRVLDGDHAFGGIDHARHGVHQSRFTRAGAARDDDVQGASGRQFRERAPPAACRSRAPRDARNPSSAW